VTSGALENWTAEHEARTYDDPLLEELKGYLLAGKRQVLEAVQFVKTKGTQYLDLAGRPLVDAAITVIIGHLLLGQAAFNERKKHVARRFLNRQMPVLETNCRYVLSGDVSVLEQYELLAGPVPPPE